MSAPDPGAWRGTWQARVEAALDAALPADNPLDPQLAVAMRHAALGPGKRLRPLLCLAACQALDGNPEQALQPGCAVELLHAYSLVHDDLPAMDDDALRRGQPTVHVAFGEATAILAGDALQALAFAHLGSAPGLGDTTRLAMVNCLAAAAGPLGMVGGQALDMAATGASTDLDTLTRMHRAKTGALLQAALHIGGQAALDAADGPGVAALDRCADALGLAFQVRDDVLDASADTATLGKPAGSDAERGKHTFVDLLGLDGAQAHAAQLTDTALTALEPLGAAAGNLRALVGYVLRRDH